MHKSPQESHLSQRAGPRIFQQAHEWLYLAMYSDEEVSIHTGFPYRGLRRPYPSFKDLLLDFLDSQGGRQPL